MHRVELKAITTPEYSLRLTPFLMHRVELKELYCYSYALLSLFKFLMHRVELKARSP